MAYFLLITFKQGNSGEKTPPASNTYREILGMSHITTEQALQIPQQLQRQGSQQESTQHTESNEHRDDSKKILKDDAVTLMLNGIYTKPKHVNISSYKSEIGQESSYVKETLKNKLAEYNLNPNTKLNIKKNLFGELEIEGSLRPSDHEKLTIDLNNNAHFKKAFDKLSQQEPTLNYVDNVVKISKAYGVDNSLFDTLISEKSEHNRLNDIAHRYEALKTSQTTPDVADTETATYRFVLNA